MVASAFLCPGRASLRAASQQGSSRTGSRQGKLSVVALQSVRPYTVRKGDTLESIATKRELRVEDIVNYNSDVNVKKLAEGQTILIPAGKLSARDKEILDGIGPRTYRLYPVRKGENIDDIMSRRGILRTEMEALNPGVNLDKLKENTVLKLPSNKFTKREKEMLAGTGLVPLEFFSNNKAYGWGIVGAVVAATVVAYVTRKKSQE